VRTVKTASGATAVQIVWSTRRGSRKIEHLGSTHDNGEVEALKAAARQRLAEGQGTFDLGLTTAGGDGDPLEIISTKSSHLWAALCRAYQARHRVERSAGAGSGPPRLTLVRAWGSAWPQDRRVPPRRAGDGGAGWDR